MKKNLTDGHPVGRMLFKLLLFMKLFALFSFVLCMQISAATYSQSERVTLRMKNASLEQIFKKLEKSTEYTFLYRYDYIEKVERRDVDYLDKSLNEVLDDCLSGTNLTYRLLDNTIIIKSGEAQNKEDEKKTVVTGKVVGKGGEPLPGVSVMIKGTSVGTATNSEGKFEIKLSEINENTTLLFTFIGMKSKEVKIFGKKDIKVTLEEDKKELDEVIITGYGRKKKSSFTGNVTTVTSKEILKNNTKNVIKALESFDPSLRIKGNSLFGSDPNALPELSLRGNSSIGAKGFDIEQMKQEQRVNLKNNPNLPIFFLDGFEVSMQEIYDMDMNRIENITILKDAAATAMYGSRAANGIILITTKVPEPGKVRVNYTGNYTIDLPDLSDYNMCNARQKLEVEKAAGKYQGYDDFSNAENELKYNEILLDILKGVETDWMAQPLRNTFNHRHSFNIQGGTRELRYQLDINYDKNDGVMKGSYRNTRGAALYLGYNYKKVKISNKVTYDRFDAMDSPYGTFNNYVKMCPYFPIYDEEGNRIDVYKDPSGIDRAKNPLYGLKLQNYKGDTQNDAIRNNLNIEYRITDNIRFDTRFSAQKSQNISKDFVDPQDPEFYWRKGIKYRGRLSERYEDSYSWNIVSSLSYNQEIGKHFVNATLSFEASKIKNTSNSMSYYGFQIGNLNSPQFAAKQPDKTLYQEDESRASGMVMNVGYSYNNIYLFDASFRYDGSSKFGEDKRFAPFWAVGTGINIHNYEFLKYHHFISRLKIRGSYGSTGKITFPSYTAVTTYQMNSDYWYKTGPGAYLLALGNPLLKWETTKKLDYGFDLGILRNKFSLKMNFYREETEDLNDTMHLRESSGFESYRTNVGTVENKGFEIFMDAILLRTSDLILSMSANLAHNKNEIIELSEATKAYNEELHKRYYTQGRYPGDGYDARSLPLPQYYVGKSTTAIYAVKSEGIDPANGRERFIKKNGMPTYTWNAEDQVVVGDYSPDAQGSINLNLGYKGIYVSTAFSYAWGGQIYNNTIRDKVENIDVENDNVDKRALTQRWEKIGDITPYLAIRDNNTGSVPRIVNPTSRYVQDENYLEFSSFSIGYDFDNELIKKWGLARLGLQFTSNNAFRISTVRQERGTFYPYARNYSFTINIGL